MARHWSVPGMRLPRSRSAMVAGVPPSCSSLAAGGATPSLPTCWPMMWHAASGARGASAGLPRPAGATRAYLRRCCFSLGLLQYPVNDDLRPCPQALLFQPTFLPRSYHTATVIGEEVWLCGGGDSAQVGAAQAAVCGRPVPSLRPPDC